MPEPPGLAHRSMEFGGRTRTWVTIGADAGPGHPVLVVLHGRNGTGVGMAQSGFIPLAQRRGVQLIFPDGVEGSWNDERPGVDSVAHRTHVDDLGFLQALVADAVSHDGADPTRVALAGHSNGALFAAYAACHPGPAIRAVVLVSGAGGDTLPGTCATSSPLSVLELHGTADRTVPLMGGPIASGDGRSRGRAAPVASMLAVWCKVDRCGPASASPPVGAPSVIETRSNGLDGSEVTSIVVTGGGHQWPLVPGFDVAGVAWSFLARQGVVPEA
jgi:polyhydroxybutyrate depolymerase